MSDPHSNPYSNDGAYTPPTPVYPPTPEVKAEIKQNILTALYCGAFLGAAVAVGLGVLGSMTTILGGDYAKGKALAQCHLDQGQHQSFGGMGLVSDCMRVAGYRLNPSKIRSGSPNEADYYEPVWWWDELVK